MEIATKQGDSRTPSSTSSSSASSSIINGSLHQHIITRSDHYPTTFVQADTSSFKQVVQMLTGSSSPRSPDSPRPPPPTPSGKSNFVIPPIKTAQPKKHSGNKLYERRSHRNSLMINTLMIGGGNGGAGSPRFSPRNQEILSPSCLDFPKLALNSPVTPLKHGGGEGNDCDTFDRMSPLSEEERAMSEKGYYLHRSPITTPRESEPQLLPLFPVASPRVSAASPENRTS
ncbi:VQ motif-containing protein 19 [Raphanus sativus]|uniref:VQ motif-containing protein 19-like n=1 Tax=Raphanus sativus TaxID=3726 RepID=A0A9W3BW20_RAPSA|nr:VQ motif-containing protein 19-like [Raphanus sativus]KAJ4886565.1 VQ motif-containing protein 19 [Raphanus sativus]